MDDFQLDLAGTKLHLLPSRGLYWPDQSTLIVADLHWGKTATFRHFGMPIPDCLDDDLDRLNSLIEQTACHRLLILGDLIHGPHVWEPQTLACLDAWREAHDSLQVHLILGNHDRHAPSLPDRWQFRVHTQLHEAPFVFQHTPEASSEGYVIAGHLHPKFRLSARGMGSQTMPGFLFTPSYAVLPAFSAFIDSQILHPQASDQVYIIADDQVISTSHLIRPRAAARGKSRR